MAEPSNYDNDDDDDKFRNPRKRRNGENPFDDFFNNFLNQLGGGFNFDNIFEQMDFFLEDIFKRFSIRAPIDENLKSPGFVWGFRMTMGPDGKPQFERFGNTPHKMGAGKKLAPSLEREPLIDVIEDTEVLRIIAEIPGVRKQDIDLSATETSLLIQAKSQDNKRNYYKELNLPCTVVPESASAKFKNGVLEVELKREDLLNKPGTKVKVD